MKKLISGVLAFLCLTTSLSAAQLTVKRGTVIRLLPPADVDFDSLSYGTNLTFTVAEDLVVDGHPIAVKGDPVDGEIIYGFGGFICGIPEMAIVQFSHFEKKGVRIPLMKSVQINGKNRLGLLIALSLPTLGCSLLFTGGKLQGMKHKPIRVATMAPVTVDIP